MWSDVATNPATTRAELASCRSVFDMVLPELKPSSIHEVLAFLKNKKAVRSLKQQIRDSLVNGYELDTAWANEIRDAASHAQIVARRRQRVLSWIGIGLGGIPLSGLSEAVESAIAIGEDVLQDRAGASLDRHSLKDFEWYYALLDIKNNAKQKSRP